MTCKCSSSATCRRTDKKATIRRIAVVAAVVLLLSIAMAGAASADGDTYTITYKDQGDETFSGVHEIGYPTTHTYGTATTLKGATKDDSTFGGWFISPDCSGSAVTELGATEYTVDITLYAKWNTDTITYSVVIPTSLTLDISGKPKTAEYSISMTSSAVAGDERRIVMSLTGSAYYSVSPVGFKVKNNYADNLYKGYTITRGDDTSVDIGEEIVSVRVDGNGTGETSESEPLTYQLNSAIVYAGTYQDKLTFTVSIDVPKVTLDLEGGTWTQESVTVPVGSVITYSILDTKKQEQSITINNVEYTVDAGTDKVVSGFTFDGTELESGISYAVTEDGVLSATTEDAGITVTLPKYGYIYYAYDEGPATDDWFEWTVKINSEDVPVTDDEISIEQGTEIEYLGLPEGYGYQYMKIKIGGVEYTCGLQIYEDYDCGWMGYKNAETIIDPETACGVRKMVIGVKYELNSDTTLYCSLVPD